MHSSIAFVLVTTLLAVSAAPAALSPSEESHPQTFIAKPQEHKVEGNASPIKPLPAKLPASDSIKPVPAENKKTNFGNSYKTPTHTIKARDTGAALNDDLLPALGDQELSAFGEESSLEGRNRRIRVLPAFLG